MQPLSTELTLGKRPMKRKQSDQDRARHQYAELTKHYRAIGPDAILAALICAPKKDKTAPKLNKAA